MEGAMHHAIIRFVTLLFAALLLTSCEKKPVTVEEVSSVFWQAVIANDKDAVVAYSTLQGTAEYDAFSRRWEKMTPSLGAQYIDGDQAQVDTRITMPDAAAAGPLEFVTYLVKGEKGWRVDYARTAEAVRVSGAVADFVSRVTSLGENIQRQLEASSADMASRLTLFVDQLDKLSGHYQQRTDKAIDAAAASMGRLLEEFTASLQQAIEELDQSPGGDASRAQLKESAESLQSSSETLANPSIDSIASTGQQLVIVSDKLAHLSDQKLQHYRRRWEQLAEEFRQELASLVALLAGAQPSAEKQLQQQEKID
jgi:hypothetical protein